MRDVFFIDNQTGWAVGTNGTIIHTSDGSDTWTPQTSGVTNEVKAVHFINNTTGWASGGPIPTFLLKTTDGGANWTALTPPSTFGSGQDVFFVDENTGYAISDSIYRSIDGGTTWFGESYGFGITGVFSLKKVYAINDSIAFVAGRNNASTNQPVATVFDRRPQSLPNPIWGSAGVTEFQTSYFDIDVLTFADEFTGFAAGFPGSTVYRMESDGINYNGPWNVNYELDTTNQNIQSITFPTANSGMFNSSIQPDQETHALIYHTSDGGDTWTSTPDTIPNILLAFLHAPDDDNAWLVGSGGKIFKGERIIVSTKDYENLAGLEVFPNPFDNNITVNISLDQPENLIIKLSNINGQKVYGNSFDLGQGETSFELENLNKLGSGIYFLNVYSEKGDFLASEKVLKF